MLIRPEPDPSAPPPLQMIIPEDDTPEYMPEPCYGYDDEGYLVSDGLPMAEHDTHRTLMFDLIAALQGYYAQRDDVYVSGNNFLHYQEGDRNRNLSPDVYVVFGAPPGPRLNFKTWKEGASPGVVIETTSKTTWREDVERKREIYARRLLVGEYFYFDPTGDYLTPRLQGFRLIGGEYQALQAETDGRLWSEELELWLVPVGDYLRLLDPVSGEYLPIYGELKEKVIEQAEQLIQERLRVESEQARAEQERLRAEAEQARAEQERLRAEAEKARAEQERQLRKAEQSRAEQERVRAETAEMELARLRAELERLRPGSS